jgi:hypothetical protein
VPLGGQSLDVTAIPLIGTACAPCGQLQGGGDRALLPHSCAESANHNMSRSSSPHRSSSSDEGRQCARQFLLIRVYPRPGGIQTEAATWLVSQGLRG